MSASFFLNSIFFNSVFFKIVKPALPSKSRNFLYSRTAWAVIAILALAMVASPRSLGQQLPELKPPMETPEEKPAETKKAKPQKGPRAVGLLRMDSKGKATLIPVAILVEGKFYDASSYKADPVPMALEAGTVYEAEQGGESQGLFTVGAALHNKNAGSLTPWVGTGSYLPRGTEAPKTTHTAEDVPVGMDSTADAPPRLTKGKASVKEAAPSSPAPASGSGDSASSKSSTSSDGAQDKSKNTTPAAGQAGDSPAGAPAGQSSPKPPSQRTSDSGDKAQSSSEPEQNYYRPTLRRGKPTEPAPVETEATPATGKAGAASDAPGNPAQAFNSSESVKSVPAISDAGGPTPRPYKFFWKEGEEDERRTQMLSLATEELRVYVNARAKGTIGAKAEAAKTGESRRKSAVKPAQPVFEDIRFQAFDVWVNNQPVMILSAEARMPAGSATPAMAEPYHITLAARTDIYGSLRKMYSGITDKFHLDVTPRLELIDVVDADGDGRGELIFRKTTDSGSGYVIYRPTADKLWKMFDSGQ